MKNYSKIEMGKKKWTIHKREANGLMHVIRLTLQHPEVINM